MLKVPGETMGLVCLGPVQRVELEQGVKGRDRDAEGAAGQAAAGPGRTW